MSGQPSNTILEMKKYRQQYLANLDADIALDNLNYDANRLYQTSGEVSAVADTRSVEERLTDLYTLRNQVSKLLLSITDGAEAQQIVSELGDEELRFLANQIQTIISELKPKYAQGIPSKAFMNYFKKYMDVYERNEGVSDGLQEATGQQILATQELIRDVVSPIYDDAKRIIQMLHQANYDNTQQGAHVVNLLQSIQYLTAVIPDIQKRIQTEQNQILKGELNQQLNYIMSNLITHEQMVEYTTALNRGTANRDTKYTNAVLNAIAEQEKTLQELKAIAQSITKGVPSQSTGSSSIGSSYQDFVFHDANGVSIRYINPSRIGKTPSNSVLKTYLSFLEQISSNLYGNENKTEVLKTKANMKEFLYNNEQMIKGELEQEMLRQQPHLEADIQMVQATPVKGKGLIKSVKKPKVITDGIKPFDKYLQIGKNILLHDKLLNDIVSLKTGKFNKIPSMPNKKVSHHLSSVIKKISGGSIPTYEDIQKLDDEERDYLALIASKSNIEDKIKIPSPKKTQDEADINQFHILKGMIMAGNDSLEIVKKFKKILISLYDRGLLPKGEVHKMLIALTDNMD